MKFALLNMDLDEQTVKDTAIVNIGSVAMRLGIQKLLLDMGISADDIINIPLSQLNTYSGEYVIMPINMHWMQDVGNKRLLSMSSKIIPVFLSISLNDTSLEQQQVDFLKKYEPIGCRDDRTMMALRGYGIASYVFGCLAGILDVEDKDSFDSKSSNKVFFADVPYGVKKYIPEEYKEDIVFVEHEIKAKNLSDNITPEEYTLQLIRAYKENAKLIVTSRFHGAVLALALGIPVIVINETLTFRFSWLKKIVPFYTREEFAYIDWHPKVVDFKPIQEQMIEIARKRIGETCERYWKEYSQSEKLELSFESDYGLIDYYDEALEFIVRKWKKEEKFNYAIWGVNNNAEKIYQYISMNYPNAHLEEVYDSYKELQFHGVSSIKPNEIKHGGEVFTFVTTFVAGYFAEELFESIGIRTEDYFICKRRYITYEDL